MADVMSGAESVCRALLELGGAGTPSGLTLALPDILTTSTVRTGILSYAERNGWITRTQRKVELTAKGHLRFGTRQLPRESVLVKADIPVYAPPVGRYEAVVSRLPMPHQMFVEMVIDAIIARRHLANVRNEPWPGFAGIGGSGTGKTTMHRLICRLCDFEITACTVNLTQAHTSGELKGLWGGLKHGFVPSKYMGFPYLVFEEVDKDAEKIKLIDPYFLGEIKAETRGKSYRILPVPVILGNPPEKGERYSLIHPAWRRRSVFLDTQYLSAAEKIRIEDFAEWLDTPGNLEPGMLSIESFTVPERLSEPGKAMLQCVRELLSTDFRNRDLYSGTGPLELITLGHIALHGQSHEIAAWHIGLFYLAIASTIPDQIVPDALPMWNKLYDHAGESLSVLRGIIKSSKSASQLARRSAGVAKIQTPEDLASARIKFRADKLKGLRAVDNWLKLFDPELFYADTQHFVIAAQFGDEFTAIRAEIKDAGNHESLRIAITIHNKACALAEQYTEYLREELARIEREESEESENEPGYDDVIDGEVIDDDNEPGTSVANRAIPDCWQCTRTGNYVSDRISRAQVRARTSQPAMPFVDLCTSCFSAIKMSVPGIEVVDRYPDAWQAARYNRAPLAIAAPGAPGIPDLMTAVSQWRNRPKCQFQHMFKRAATVALTSSRYSSFAAREPGTHTVYCCDDCREKGINYIDATGFPYFHEKKLGVI